MSSILLGLAVAHLAAGSGIIWRARRIVFADMDDAEVIALPRWKRAAFAALLLAGALVLWPVAARTWSDPQRQQRIALRRAISATIAARQAAQADAAALPAQLRADGVFVVDGMDRAKLLTTAVSE